MMLRRILHASLPPSAKLCLNRTINLSSLIQYLMSSPTPRLFTRLRPSTRLAPSTLSLDHFLQRQRALSLWREILRATGQVSSPNTAKELRMFARSEFERNRNVADLKQIRYLISTGVEQLNNIKKYLIIRNGV